MDRAPGQVMKRSSGIVDGHWFERIPRGPFLLVTVETCPRSLVYANGQHVHTAVWARAVDRLGRMVQVIVRTATMDEWRRAHELRAWELAIARAAGDDPCP